MTKENGPHNNRRQNISRYLKIATFIMFSLNRAVESEHAKGPFHHRFIECIVKDSIWILRKKKNDLVLKFV